MPINPHQLWFSFSASTYTPPLYNQLQFRFALPSGINPDSADYSEYGTPTVFNLRQYVDLDSNADGWDSAVVQDPANIYNASLLPEGVIHSLWGVAEVVNRNRYYALTGFDSFTLGGLDIANRNRLVYPAAINVGDIPVPTGVTNIGRYHPTTPYVPPAYNQLVFNFTTGTYTAPSYDQIRFIFAFPSDMLAPDPIAPIGFGTTDIANLIREVAASSWDSSLYGTPDIGAYTYLPILPGGIAPPPQTGPNGDRQIPSPFIDFRIRYLTPGGIAVPTNQIATTHDISHYTRFVDLAGRGPNGWATGTSRVEFAVRYIEPPFIVSNIFGTHNIVRIQILLPSGWGSSFVSDNAELDINLQRLLHHSGASDPAGYGNTHVRNQYENVNPLGWLSQDISFPIVYNLRQHVYAGAYMNTTGDPTTWPIYSPFVENKIRVLGPGAWQSSRFSVIGNIVENKAVPIIPAGLDATIWGPDTFIAYRDRTIPVLGWDSFYNTHYTIVYNAAAVIAPTGIASTVAFGRPDPVLNLNRTVAQIFPSDDSVFGTAFIADRIRNITTRLIVEPPSGFPEVRHNPYPIAPAGIQSLVFGNPTVYEHFNVLFPRSTNVHSVPWVGEPIVENRNKTLAVFPSDQSLYGLAKVFNYNTHLTITAGDLTVWGSHLISYRTRTITVAPISVPVFSVTHRIRNVIPDPPARQLIEPNSVVIGLDGNPGIVPSPGTRLATIYPEGINEEGYGQPKLTRNTIEVPPWSFNLDQVGQPSLNATQYLYPKTLPWPNNPNTPISSSDENWVWAYRPRVTPHTIYAPSGDQATWQAQENNPGHAGDKIDGSYPPSGGSLGLGWPWFGRPDVSNQHRVVGPVPNHNSGDPPGLSPTVRFGNQTFTLSRQYVYPTPIRSLRFGLIMFLGVPQYVNLDSSHNGIAPLNDFGQHTVVPPPVVVTPEAKPFGFVATMWGTHRVELFNREVTPTGIPHRGNPQQNLTNPWGVPLVGFPRVYNWGGYDLTLWGTTWVSNYTRSFEFQGWLSSTLPDDDLGSFADRMRVSQRNVPGGLAGIPPSNAFGNAVVGNGIRTIIGRGIAALEAGLPRITMLVVVTGWDSALFGDIDEWEAGKIKPYGPDMSEYGIPRMARGIWVPGYNGGYIPNPAVARPIYVSGLPPIGFDGPSVTDEFGCNTRVITPLPVLSIQTTPTPNVFIAGYLLVFGIYEGAVPTPGTERPNSLFASGTAPLNTFGDHDIFNYDAHTDPIEEDL